MKKIKSLFMVGTGICLFTSVFLNGCSKEIPAARSKLDILDLKLNVDYSIFSKDLKLRLSPGLETTVLGDFTQNAEKLPRGIEKMTSILKEDQAVKKSKPNITRTSAVTFTATSAGGGTYYNCYGEVDEPGPTAWWLTNTYTWVMTPLGTTPDNYIAFYVNKPDLYGSYRLWGENVSTTSGGYTGYQYMGDTYSGVSMVSGVMSFTDTTALMVIEARIAAAMESHLSNFADPLNYMSEDDYNTYAENAGFDEFLPMREFEASFGHYSLRQKIESEEIAWLNSSSDPWLVSTNPDDRYDIEDEYDRVFRNQYSQVKISGVLFEPISVIEGPSTPIPCSGGNNSMKVLSAGACYDDEKNANWIDLSDGRRIHYKVKKEKGAGESAGSNVIRSFFKGKLRCYKKKGSLFSKRRTQMMVRIQGTAYIWDQYQQACGALHHTFDENRPLKRSWHRDKEKTYRRYTYMKGCETYATFTVAGNSPFVVYLQ